MSSAAGDDRSSALPPSAPRGSTGLPESAVRELATLAGVALSQERLEDTHVEICRIAVRAVPGADGASITTFPDGRPSAVADSDWAKRFDELQYEEHEGPCLDAFRTGNAFRIRDVAVDNRWPSYLPRAAEHGGRSMLSLPMTAEGKIIGALNLYSREVDVFTSEGVSVGGLVAAHAGMASQVAAALFGHRELADQLTEALQSRAVIEQAKGVLMAVHSIDADEAFQRLRVESQHSHRKLRDVAIEFVERVSKPS
jgi:transcriptional regulator with GAF, ATPase, and Fis domain